MNEGFLGKYTFGGERAATDDHPTVIHYLPLAASVSEKLDVGLLLKAVDVYGATAVVGAENTGVTAASVTLETLAAKSTGTVVGCCAALAEGDAAKRTDIFFLEPLPLFAH